MTDQKFWLHNVSVVVTAQFHNPSVLNPGFLVSEGIVPKNWKVNEAITTPQMSRVSYRDGTSWDVLQDKLSVSEDCTPFQESFDAYEQTAAYIKSLPHVPYSGLGLNAVFSFPVADPTGWMTQRFLKLGQWDESRLVGLQMVPRFVFLANDAICTLTLNHGSRTPSEDEEIPAVIIQSNLHHEGVKDVDSLCSAIELWKQKRDLVLSALSELFEDDGHE